MIITSGFNIEGYRIDNYLGFISGESALGTGFLSSFGAGIADVLGTNSDMYSKKMLHAKEIAIGEMEYNAKRLGANAIIGVQVNYVVFSEDIVGVNASGTAVHIIKCFDDTELEDSSIIDIPVINYYKDYFIPYNLQYDAVQQRLQVELNVKESKKVQAINADIIFKTIFGTDYIYKDVNFTEFSGEDTYCISESVPMKIPQNQMKIIQSAIIQINYCLLENECITLGENYLVSTIDIKKLVKLRQNNGNDVVADYEQLQSSWLCLCGESNESAYNKCSNCGRERGVYGIQGYDEFMAKLETFDCVKDMYGFSVEDANISEVIVTMLKKYADLERLYGNMKNECMQELRKMNQTDA